ncbi:hypothetical protein HY990_01570 [Candidatus Micrarchaeota archaeon]|nr:hypothetical protein [Candidatus Micrarchaeota archaeon]
MSNLRKVNIPEVRERIRCQSRISTFESLGVLVDGFASRTDGFAARDRPSILSGGSFIRIAGQAADLTNGNRREIKRILEQLVPTSPFLIMGHGGLFKCGAVAAKKIAVENGGTIPGEPKIVNKLVERITPEVCGRESPEAEMINAQYQAQKILDDPELREIIDRKHIVVIAAVCGNGINTVAMNRPKEYRSIKEHIKLRELNRQLAKVIRMARDEQMPLDRHYAHAIFAYDPFKLRKILDPYHPHLELGGVCCVDARLAPLTPDGPRYLFRLFPNQGFSVTVAHTEQGVELSSDDAGSIVYAGRHVGGVKESRHMVCLDTELTLVNARATAKALVGIDEIRELTQEGSTISLIGFDGREMRVSNEYLGIDEMIAYDPVVRILG